MGSIVAELADKIAADSGLSQVKSIEIEQSSTGGVAGALKVDNDDVDKQAIVVEAANTTADVFDITADAVTTAKVIDITADGLTTGSALYIDDNSADTGTRSDVTIIQNHDSAIAATALTVQSDAGVTGMLLDKNFPAAAVAAATVRGLWVDFDHTVPGSGTAAQHDIGIDLDVNSATLGTSTSTGLDIDVVGATTGTHTVVGLDVTVSAADVNYAAKFAGGGIMIKEQAAADTDIASYGQLWVDDAAKSPLYFTTDDGDDIQITSGTSLAVTGGGSMVHLLTAALPTGAGNTGTTFDNFVDSDYTSYRVIIKNLQPATDATEIRLVLAANADQSLITTGAYWSAISGYTSDAGDYNLGIESAGYMRLFPNVGTTNIECANADLLLTGLNTSTSATLFTGSVSFMHGGGYIVGGAFGGGYVNSTQTAESGFQLQTTSGNFATGSCSVYGIKTS